MNILVSVPKHSRQKEEIMSDFSQASAAIKKIFSAEKNLFIQPNYCDYVCSENDKGKLYYLGRAIQLLDGIDTVYFCPGWENSKRCKAEHYICELYGIQRIEV